jgi:hypothetical protein
MWSSASSLIEVLLPHLVRQAPSSRRDSLVRPSFEVSRAPSGAVSDHRSGRGAFSETESPPRGGIHGTRLGPHPSPFCCSAPQAKLVWSRRCAGSPGPPGRRDERRLVLDPTSGAVVRSALM